MARVVLVLEVHCAIEKTPHASHRESNIGAHHTDGTVGPSAGQREIATAVAFDLPNILTRATPFSEVRSLRSPVMQQQRGIGSLSPDGHWWWDGHAWQLRGVGGAGRHRRMRRIVIWAVIAPVALIVGGLFGLDLWLQHVGCGSVDPTDPGNYSTVSIRNDTPRPVTIGDCRGAYCYDTGRVGDNSGAPFLLRPGKATIVNAACGVSRSDATSWRLADVADNTIGFIAVNTPRKHDGLIYAVSRATTSRDRPATPIVPRPLRSLKEVVDRGELAWQGRSPGQPHTYPDGGGVLELRSRSPLIRSATAS